MKLLEDVLRWARGTDLAEVEFRRDGDGLGFRLEGAALNPPPLPSCSLVPVRSPGVGLYRAGALGKAGAVLEGRAVAEGESLGQVEALGKAEPVKAPCAGKLVSPQVEDGKPVQYGQALFFIEP
ncbi:MAG: biotin/lipoyl-containing protein [Elusimicrobiota bacterium]|jgi:acetyl-CoA carboxylase biotin carboxyl carrier protein